MERATGTEVYGCGSPQSTDLTLNIQTTTGGNFSVSLNGKNTVEHLKKLVSKKLRVAKDRICLLHRERQLMDGTLEENGVFDGSRIILLPSVETGLLSSRPENSVMQALESLNDTQVNDFLSGKSPLNLTMRLGDHMMLIQLQLSTLTSGSRSIKTSNSAKSSTSAINIKQDVNGAASPQKTTEKILNFDKPITPQNSNVSDKNILNNNMKANIEKAILKSQDIEMLKTTFDLCRKMFKDKSMEKIATECDKEEKGKTFCPQQTQQTLSNVIKIENEQTPIKSLSNLVSSPIASTSECRDSPTVSAVKSSLIDLLSKSDLNNDLPPIQCGKRDKLLTSASSPTPDSSLSDDSDTFAEQSSFLTESTIDEYPMENLFNSAVDKGLFEDQDDTLMDREISNLATTSHGSQQSNSSLLPSFQSISEPLKNKRFQYLLHKTSKFKHPIGQNKQKAFMQSVVNKHKKRMQTRQDNILTQPSTSRTEPYITNSRKLILQPSSEIDTSLTNPQPMPSTSKQSLVEAPKKSQRDSPVPATIDTRALIEASKNLTQKLKKLSREVLTNKIEAIRAERAKIERPGAVIESMKHHGKGIYSGTFSGTLNPALQDRYGRPKRDISTIIHILNDLLCASPPIKFQKQSPYCTNGDKKCLNCSQPFCTHVKCDGQSPSTSAVKCECTATECNCKRLEAPSACPTCSIKSPGEALCKKCDTAKLLALENSKTKCKVEQLRLVMQQKKQRREERKLKTLPYTSASQKITSEQTKIQEETVA